MSHHINGYRDAMRDIAANGLPYAQRIAGRYRSNETAHYVHGYLDAVRDAEKPLPRVDDELDELPDGTYRFVADGVAIDWPLLTTCSRFLPVTPGHYGFTITETGGGCTAWRRDFTLHGVACYMLITDEASHEIPIDAREVTMGVYCDDLDAWCIWQQSVDAADPAVEFAKAHGITREGSMPSPDSLPDTLLLAVKFSEILRDDLGPEIMREIIAKNRTADYGGDICASHDYCDANMVMAAAWEDITGCEPDIGNEPQARIWGLAWAAAKASEFNSQGE